MRQTQGQEEGAELEGRQDRGGAQDQIGVVCPSAADLQRGRVQCGSIEAPAEIAVGNDDIYRARDIEVKGCKERARG